MLRALMLAAAVFSATTAFADRPTAGEVSAAVAAQYKTYVEQHPTFTQAEAIAALEADIDKFTNDVAVAVRRAPREARQSVRRKYDSQIDDAREKLRTIRVSYTPEQSRPQLLPLSFDHLKVGTVGRISDDAGSAVYGAHIHCLQIIDPTRVLAIYRFYRSTTNPAQRMLTHHSRPFLLSGIDASDLQEDAPIKQYPNVVVVGQYSYETAVGTMRTVPVLEIFDPDKPWQ